MSSDCTHCQQSERVMTLSDTFSLDTAAATAAADAAAVAIVNFTTKATESETVFPFPGISISRISINRAKFSVRQFHDDNGNRKNNKTNEPKEKQRAMRRMRGRKRMKKKLDVYHITEFISNIAFQHSPVQRQRCVVLLTLLAYSLTAYCVSHSQGMDGTRWQSDKMKRE